MTLYAGETIQVRHHVSNYDDGELGEGDVDVLLQIWDLDGITVLVEAPMEYSPDLVFEDGTVGGWRYLWATPADAPGAYRAKCTVTGTGMNAWEYKTIRLRKSKEAVVAP